MRVTELVEPVLVLQPSLVSRVDLASLARKQKATSKQASSEQAASTHEMGKNQSSVVVLPIQPKFSWMLPIGVRDNHTKYEPETQWWRPRTGVASAGPPVQNLQFRAKINLCLPKAAREPAEGGQPKGNPGYCIHAARLPRAEGPSRALLLHNMFRAPPPNGPQRP